MIPWADQELTGKRVGLILNFNEPTLKKGVQRFVMDKKDESVSLTQGKAPSNL